MSEMSQYLYIFDLYLYQKLNCLKHIIMRSLAALVMAGMMIMALFSEDQLAEAKVSKCPSQITFEMLNM